MEKMTLNEEHVRLARDWYREWNRAELHERARNAGKNSPNKGWKIYLSLWQFYCEMDLRQSPRQREHKVKDLERYYSRVAQLEGIRRNRGK